MEPEERGLEVLIHRLRQAQRSAIQAELQSAELGDVCHPLLLCVLGTMGPGCTQRELARRMDVSPAAVATSLKSLEKRGYVRREPEPEDARCNRVELTERGRQAAGDCAECYQRLNQRMLRGLTGGEREQLRTLCNKMLENLLRPEEADS